MERCFGADFLDEVDLLGVDESFILICVVLLPNRNPCEGRTLLPEMCDNRTGINARYSRDTFLHAPLAQTLDGSPMAVLFCNIGHYYTCCLQIRRLEVSKQSIVVSSGRRDPIVADQGLCED